ncbi:SRPBCC family protein [Pedobacter frigoris]|uniref:SRPBCC family protein n=1 Tax=Pedobacter frigoris TaxID=2571272 RepID=A0A4U1CHW2_9SPHI|nr:SRPBCC family protein [Pedobacter frigoris]TKC06953.1 hypothetical protein FA047_06690 [Pedobacter frigoris]
MNLLSYFPQNPKTRLYLSVLGSTIICGLLTLLGIYGIGSYGMYLFVLIPLLMGISATWLYTFGREVAYKHKAAFLTLLVSLLLLLVFAIEGLICIGMASPILLLFLWTGSYIGYGISRKKIVHGQAVILFLFLVTPLTAFVETTIPPVVRPVTTSIVIKASPEEVWKNVVEFPELKAPTEFIFKTGIAYPINAVIEGRGVGAVRHCNFTTGSFVEPITVWDEPRLLKFNVQEQPAPMKELSFYDIDAPHLHDYFVSKRGQFKLTKLANGNTLLEGTTWYFHNIKPELYWSLWSKYIIHKIHMRVLEHIKENSEG